MSEEREDLRIVEIRLEPGKMPHHSPHIEHERAIAIADLLERNFFYPVGEGGQPLFAGPYHLHLHIRDNRLHFDISGEAADRCAALGVPMAPFRSLIKDYFLICDSYYKAVQSQGGQVEAIDMGRRGLHNEGSQLLLERLSSKLAMNFETARRLFTLICVLHLRSGNVL